MAGYKLAAAVAALAAATSAATATATHQQQQQQQQQHRQAYPHAVRGGGGGGARARATGESAWGSCVVSGLQPNGTGSWTFKAGVKDSTAVAWVNFMAVADGGVPGTTGFSSLSVSTNGDYSDTVQMYGAGWCEGYVTAGQIGDAWDNLAEGFFPYMFNTTTLPEQYQTYFATQDSWARANVASNSSALWTEMGGILAQGDGMAAGYAAAAPDRPVPWYGFALFSATSDLYDVMAAYPPTEPAVAAAVARRWTAWEALETPEAFMAQVHRSTHCSGLVKVAPDFSDIYLGHSTWAVYTMMLRIYKHYKLALQNGAAVGREVSYSSYPGTMSSVDDWLTVYSSGLVVIETTNNIFNTSLYAAVVPQSLLAWQRVRLASMLARSPPAWHAVFSQYNSGTYNNAYMVVNVGAFVPGAPLAADFMWEVEQIPGLVVGGDVTRELEYGYFPSYNVPFWPVIYELSGYPAALARFGFNASDPATYAPGSPAAPMMGIQYQLAPRAKIFRRDQYLGNNIYNFFSLMRYNNYLKDPFSAGNPWFTICARGDLANATSGGAMPEGCYDTKVTAASWWGARQSMIINGPTTSYGLAPFAWAPFPGYPHAGVPAVMNFSSGMETPSYVTVTPPVAAAPARAPTAVV